MKKFLLPLLRSRIFWLVLGSSAGFGAQRLGASADQAAAIRQNVTQLGPVVGDGVAGQLEGK